MKFWKKKQHPFDYTRDRTCLTCGNAFQGKFCSACGEKVVEPYDRSIKHFLDNLLNAFTFIDSKFYNSLKTMIKHPGSMTADISIGKRLAYMKPVAFFFVGNFIYFLLPLFETFNTTLKAQMEFMPYKEYVVEEVEAHLNHTGQTFEQFSIAYNAASTNWAKLILIVLAPLTFPFVALVNYSKKNYLSDHFLFSLEFAAFTIFVPTIIYPLTLFMVYYAGQVVGVDLVFIFKDRYNTPVILVSLLYFLVVGTRNFYEYTWWRSVCSGLLLTLSMYVVIHAYRFLLFNIAMWSAS